MTYVHLSLFPLHNLFAKVSLQNEVKWLLLPEKAKQKDTWECSMHYNNATNAAVLSTKKFLTLHT